MNIARHGRKRPAPPTAEHDQWATVLISFDTLTEPLTNTACAAPASGVHLTSDGSDE